ncbi:MAG: metallophosphoesterase [Acetatifactor sp.]|nr:metallophosphoesterase [Acetatifactor sp.]
MEINVLQKILFGLNRRENGRISKAPLGIRQMERVLARISCMAGSAGLSAASFALALWHCMLRLVYGNDSIIINMSDGQAVALAVAAFLFCALWLLLKKGFEKSRKDCLEVYPNAAAYYRQCAEGCTVKTILCFATAVLGYILSICLPNYLRYNDMRFALAVCAVTITYSTFHFVFQIQEWRICRRIKVRITQDSDQSDHYDFHGERKRGIIRWLVYWIVALAGYLTISTVFRSLFMYGFYFVLIFVNFLLRIMNNNPFRRFSGIRSKLIPVRILNIASLLVLAGLSFYVIENGSDYNGRFIESLDYEGFENGSSYTYDSDTGVYTISGSSEEFRILQLTDIHICGSIGTIQTDRKALKACYDLIRETRPDMIIITGDLVYPMPIQTFSKDNLGAFGQLCELMDHIGIPWAFVYGNHDTEAAAAYQAEQLKGLFHYYSNASAGALLYADRQPEIYGRYNQYIRVENTDGSLNSLLFLIDSNDCVKDAEKINEYDSVHEDQIQWYADTIENVSGEEGRLIPSFVFMHIPFQAFAEAQEALQDGNADAVYLFGENGEGVSCPEREFGFFEAIVQKQSTRAVFVGHDHLNNMAVKYKDVDLVYSKSIDYYAYPGIADKTEQRGATLITLFPNGSYQIEQVDYRMTAL